MGRKTYRILIDGGSSSKSSVGTYQILPYLKHEGIGRLDAVFLSHEDLDHCSGVPELMEDMEKGGIGIGALFLPDIGQAGEAAYGAIVPRAKSLNIPVTFLHGGQSLMFGEMSLACLGPEAEGRAVASERINAHSMVLRLSYGDFSALFTGDVEGEGLEALKEVLRRETERGDAAGPLSDIDLLKVSHHGSRLATDEEFLALTRPEVALISCGRNNRYGHPHEETMELLTAAGAQIFVTANTGAITVDVLEDGRQYRIQ